MKRINIFAVVMIVIFSLIIIIGSLLQTGCKNSESGKRPAKIQRDTSRVLALYKIDSVVRFDITSRVTADTFIYVDTDTVTKKKMWTRDTVYIVPYPITVDSDIAKRYNKPMLDSNGKRNVVLFNITVNKRFIRDGWWNVDSAVAELKRLK